MSIYLVIVIVVHLRKFDRNRFRVLFAWFDFIHRCFFHSRWSCTNQAKVIPALDLHTSFRSMIIEYSMLTLYILFQTPYLHSLVIDLGSNHRLTRFHHFITTQIGLASMFQSFVWSMLRMKIRNLWEIEDPNWNNRVWSMIKIEMCYTWLFCRLVTIEWRLSSEWTGLYWIVS